MHFFFAFFYFLTNVNEIKFQAPYIYDISFKHDPLKFLKPII